MLSIDEAIEQFKYDAECNRTDLDLSYAEENEQVAEWLEELKALREEKSDFQIMAKDIAEGNYEMGMENGYNKAVDDFVHECDKHCEFYSGKNKNITREDILKIAEQLKERNNDKENKSSKKV